MSNEFSIDRNSGKRGRDTNKDTHAAGTDPGANEWDLSEGPASREAPQAEPEAAAAWETSQTTSEAPEPQATEPAAASMAQFRDLMEDEDEERSSLPGIDIRRLCTILGGLSGYPRLCLHPGVWCRRLHNHRKRVDRRGHSDQAGYR